LENIELRDLIRLSALQVGILLGTVFWTHFIPGNDSNEYYTFSTCSDDRISRVIFLDHWGDFMAQLRPRKVLCDNEILYPDHIQHGVACLKLDSQQLEAKFIILDLEPGKHILLVLMKSQGYNTRDIEYWLADQSRS
jgi:hypothetical protein